jgi:exodeoxyribonuclease VII small subunit
MRKMSEGPEKELTFEEAMERIEEITGSIESGKLKLEESIAAFEEGSRLIKFCRAKLEEYGKKIDDISGSEDNE